VKTFVYRVISTGVVCEQLSIAKRHGGSIAAAENNDSENIMAHQHGSNNLKRSVKIE